MQLIPPPSQEFPMFVFIFLTVMVRTLFVVILPPFPLSSLLNYLLLL